MQGWDSGTSESIASSAVSLDRETSPTLVGTVATAGTLTSHPNFNGTCLVTAGAKLSVSFAL